MACGNIDQYETEIQQLTQQVHIDREVFNQQNFDTSFGFNGTVVCNCAESIRRSYGWLLRSCQCSTQRFRFFVLLHLPIFSWLPKYSLRRDLVYDIIGGLTVGIMHIPQGMAYGMLAGLDRVNGLYTSFFPNLFYVFLGTSRHVSIGTFAVISVMMGNLNDRLIPKDSSNNTVIDDYVATPPPGFPPDVTPVELATSVTVFVGIILLFMSILQLGFLTSYLSDALISGFTTGASFHVLFSQLPAIFGLPRAVCSEIGKLFCSGRHLIEMIQQTSLFTFGISLVCIIFLYVIKDHIGPYVNRKTAVPIPAELIVIVIATLASHFASFEHSGVPVVGPMPTGLPYPTVPRMDLLPWIIGDSISIAIVVFSVTVSVAKIFAKKHGYKIDSNQELFALGFIQCFCSFFSCFPPSGSLARSALFESTGTRTQIAAVIGCGVVLVVLLWLGPLFYSLPTCVLSAIIIVALKSMFKQFGSCTYLLKVSKIDAFIWISSFLAVITLGVTYGLAASVAIGLLTLILRLQWPNASLLYWIPGTEVYAEGHCYTESQTIYGVKIFRFDAPLTFANAERFKSSLFRRCDIDIERAKMYLRTCPAFPPSPSRLACVENEENPRSSTPVSLKQTLVTVGVNQNEEGESSMTQDTFEEPSFSPVAAPVVSLCSPEINSLTVKYVIIDCSAFGYVDMMGLNMLKQVYQELFDIGIRVYFVSCRASLLSLFEASDFYESVPRECLYVTIHDAVVAITGGNIVGLNSDSILSR